MREERNRLILGLIWTAILLPLNIVGYIQYLNGDTGLLTLVLVLNIIDLLLTNAKIVYAVPFVIGGFIASKKFLLGIQLGLMFENILTGVLTLLVYGFAFISFFKSNKK